MGAAHSADASPGGEGIAPPLADAVFALDSFEWFGVVELYGESLCVLEYHLRGECCVLFIFFFFFFFFRTRRRFLFGIVFFILQSEIS